MILKALSRPRMWAVLAALAVSACVTTGGPAPSSPATPPEAPLPTYRVGDAFAWSNGAMEKVTAVEGDKVHWINNHDFRFTDYRSFFLPRHAWQGRTSRGGLLNELDVGMLWPLRPGASTRFNVHKFKRWTESGREKEYRFSWYCEVDDATSTTVPAGTFETYPVTCYRYSFMRHRPHKTITWYYAPALGHYVKRVHVSRWGGKKVRDLVRFKRAPVDLADLPEAAGPAVQATLESLPSGKARAWRGGGVTGTVMPVKTFQRQDGTYCRNAIVTVRRDGRQATHAVSACRDDSGRWL